MDELIELVSESFEPFKGVARVGYECTRSDDRWEVSLFLGQEETLGGACDGERSAVNFRFDVMSMQKCFDSIESLTWNNLPNGPGTNESRFDSFLTIDGHVDGMRLSLQIHALPPETAGPALRRHTCGAVELT